MTYKVKQFDFNGNNVRVVSKDGGDTLWFVAADLASVLGYSDTYEIVRNVDEDDKTKTGSFPVSVDGLRSDSVLITEAAMYEAVMRSNKPIAKPFRKWVTSEVLPSIRKTGSYSMVKHVELTIEQKYIQVLEENRKLRQQVADVLSPSYLTAREILMDVTGLPAHKLTRASILATAKVLVKEGDTLPRSSANRYVYNQDSLTAVRVVCTLHNLKMVKLPGIQHPELPSSDD